MIPVKIQCGCGQRYTFEVEPVNGRMATTVACPACGADGTAAANEFIAQSLPPQPQVVPIPQPPALPATTARPSVRPTMTRKWTILKSGIVSAVLFALVTYGTSKEEGALTKSGIFVLINSLIIGAASTGIVAFWSRRSQTDWPWWRVILTTVVCYFVVGICIVVVCTDLARLL
jgi:hypothetical protein